MGVFLLPSSHPTPQFLYSSFHNYSIQHDFQAAWFYFCKPMKQEKKEASTCELQAMASLWILIKHKKVVRFSVKYMCIGKIWKKQKLTWRFKKKKLPNILDYIHSVPLFLFPFHSLFFQNGFSSFCFVETKKEMGSHCWFWVSPSCSPSYTHYCI